MKLYMQVCVSLLVFSGRLHSTVTTDHVSSNSTMVDEVSTIQTALYNNQLMFEYAHVRDDMFIHA